MALLRPEQVRAARALLRWGVRDLADRAGISPNTVSSFETRSAAQYGTLVKIERALTDAGIIFIEADEHGGPGVRLLR